MSGHKSCSGRFIGSEETSFTSPSECGCTGFAAMITASLSVPIFFSTLLPKFFGHQYEMMRSAMMQQSRSGIEKITQNPTNEEQTETSDEHHPTQT